MQEHMAYYLVPWETGTIPVHSHQLSTKFNEQC